MEQFFCILTPFCRTILKISLRNIFVLSVRYTIYIQILVYVFS